MGGEVAAMGRVLDLDAALSAAQAVATVVESKLDVDLVFTIVVVLAVMDSADRRLRAWAASKTDFHYA
uniref:Protein of unassigned function n=1 Tax=Mesocestoides corti TaxID=53468 RepID=A0A5K3EJP3_MESCO